jgi:NOL1/NOP2/fmu family ribosome biogenesis protein
MALLCKQGKAEAASPVRQELEMSPVDPEACPALTGFWKEAVRLPLRNPVHRQNGHCFLLPEGHLPIKGLKVLRPGLYLGQEVKDRFIPSHSLAMALKPHQAVQCMEVSEFEETLQRYLAGETLPSVERGWTLVCCRGVSAGWGKASAGVLKNHYPKGLRLRF